MRALWKIGFNLKKALSLNIVKPNTESVSLLIEMIKLQLSWFILTLLIGCFHCYITFVWLVSLKSVSYCVSVCCFQHHSWLVGCFVTSFLIGWLFSNILSDWLFVLWNHFWLVSCFVTSFLIGWLFSTIISDWLVVLLLIINAFAISKHQTQWNS